MKIVSRNGWISVLLLTVTFLALTPTSLLPALYAGSTTTYFTPLPGVTFRTGAYTGIFTSSSKLVHTTIIGISMHSIYLFDFSTALNAPPGTAGLTYPGTADAGKCSNTQSCFITIDSEGDPAFGCAEYCQSAFVTISVNFPSSELPEPVTLTVSGLPAGSTFTWGNEQPASSLAPYTAMPPYTVTLGIYTNSLSTPLYGSPFARDGLPANAANGYNPPADVVTIAAMCRDCILPKYSRITLTVNSFLPVCSTADCTPKTVTYPGWTTTTIT